MSTIFPRDWFINLGDFMPEDMNKDSQVDWTLSAWAERHGYDHEALGFIPTFLHVDDPRPAAEQIDAAYQHGGGWKPNPEATNRWRLEQDRLAAGAASMARA